MASKKRSKNDDQMMAKKQKTGDSASSASDTASSASDIASSASDSSEDEMDVDEVQIDFSGFELAPEDHNGIQLLLQQLFRKNSIDLGELTHHIIEQLDVGSVIKETEIDESLSNEDPNSDDTVYGLITVVSLSPHKDLKFVDQLRTIFLSLSKKHAVEQTKTFINSMFNDEKNSVGLILNERYLNLPPSISVPSFTKLKAEIEAESKKNPRFQFTHFILVSKLYKIPSNKKKKRDNEEDLQIMWCNAEEELLDKLADARFEYPVKEDCDSGLSGKWTEDDEEMLPFRRVLIFKANKLTDLVEELRNCS